MKMNGVDYELGQEIARLIYKTRGFYSDEISRGESVHYQEKIPTRDAVHAVYAATSQSQCRV